jgi:DNA-binding SARP family transcriptional activator
MRFSILGPLEVRDDAGNAVTFTRRLHRSALTLLLLNAGQPWSSASMVSAIWGQEPPLSPECSLRSCVYGIRKVLPDPARLRTHPSGYLIIAGPGELDADDFRDMAERGRDALDAGQPKEAAALLGRALGQWREPPLDDVPAVPAKDQLIGLRQEARDALIDARLALGEHRQVLSDLRAAVAAEPLREHSWAQLMTALYRSGARAEALAAFGRLRMALVSAYGIDPGPELQDLHRRILADDPALTLPAEPRAAEPRAAEPRVPDPHGAVPRVPGHGAGEPRPAEPRTSAPAVPPAPADGQAAGPGRGAPAAATSRSAGPPAGQPGPEATPAAAPAADAGRWRPVCQLSAAVPDFTGRSAELSWLRTRLPGEGMAVTVITGMLGTGKTALAVLAAHQAAGAFPDGQLYACLDDAGRSRDPQAVLGELLRGVGAPAAEIPAARFEREALYRSVLAGRRVLVLADGATSAAQVRPLLPGTAGSAVLVTSRSRLPDLDGARSLEIAGLDPADSVALLARVSGRDLSGPGAGTGEAGDAAGAQAVAAACGHLPLALRIAGIRLGDDPGLRAAALAASLSDERRRLDELEIGGTSVRGRLGAAARAVSGPARRALALLAAPDAEDSQSDDCDARKLAPELADAGLLHRAGHDDSGARRYRLHPLVLSYAGELLAAAGPGPAAPGAGPSRCPSGGWSGRARPAQAALPPGLATGAPPRRTRPARSGPGEPSAASTRR